MSLENLTGGAGARYTNQLRPSPPPSDVLFPPPPTDFIPPPLMAEAAAMEIFFILTKRFQLLGTMKKMILKG